MDEVFLAVSSAPIEDVVDGPADAEVERVVNAPVQRALAAQTSGPNAILRCKDGHILVACVGNPLFKCVAQMIGRPDMLEDKRFKTDIDRGNNGKDLTDIMRQWTRERTCEEALAALAAAKVPGAAVLSRKPRSTTHASRRYPGMEKPALVARVPIWLSETQGCAPTIGEHAEAIMSGLGYTLGEIEELGREPINPANGRFTKSGYSREFGHLRPGRGDQHTPRCQLCPESGPNPAA